MNGSGRMIPASHPATSFPRVDVLLINLGTPDPPEPGAVRRYLAEFAGIRRRHRSGAIFPPGFSADCVETLGELAGWIAAAGEPAFGLAAADKQISGPAIANDAQLS